MDPMVSEVSTEVDMTAVSHWKMAQNSLPIMLLLWAWLQRWSGMLFHGFQICQGKREHQKYYANGCAIVTSGTGHDKCDRICTFLSERLVVWRLLGRSGFGHSILGLSTWEANYAGQKLPWLGAIATAQLHMDVGQNGRPREPQMLV